MSLKSLSNMGVGIVLLFLLLYSASFTFAFCQVGQVYNVCVCALVYELIIFLLHLNYSLNLFYDRIHIHI